MQRTLYSTKCRSLSPPSRSRVARRGAARRGVAWRGAAWLKPNLPGVARRKAPQTEVHRSASLRTITALHTIGCSSALPVGLLFTVSLRTVRSGTVRAACGDTCSARAGMRSAHSSATAYSPMVSTAPRRSASCGHSVRCALHVTCWTRALMVGTVDERAHGTRMQRSACRGSLSWQGCT